MGMNTAIETLDARIARMSLEGIRDNRLESLGLAHDAGVSDGTFRLLAEAVRVRRRPVMVLPAHRLEGMSRGRGWARQGRGDRAVWGVRVAGGYEVGPGRWTVGGHDGFNRKDETSWTVEAVIVGAETWTTAN